MKLVFIIIQTDCSIPSGSLHILEAGKRALRHVWPLFLSLSLLGIFSIYTQQWSLLLLLLLSLSSRIESIFRSIRLRIVFSVVNFIITLDKVLIETRKTICKQTRSKTNKKKKN